MHLEDPETVAGAVASLVSDNIELVFPCLVRARQEHHLVAVPFPGAVGGVLDALGAEAPPAVVLVGDDVLDDGSGAGTPDEVCRHREHAGGDEAAVVFDADDIERVVGEHLGPAVRDDRVFGVQHSVPGFRPVIPMTTETAM